MYYEIRLVINHIVQVINTTKKYEMKQGKDI